MTGLRSLCAVVLFCITPLAFGQEPDHAIHEELRGLLREVVAAMNGSEFDRMLPYLTEDFEGTSITQEVMSGREEVSKYFREWFGPAGYMRSMKMQLDADKLTALSADKSWGLVRGKGIEHYEAKDGDQFDFATRWTAVMVRNDDNKWRLRAIHFGTNHLDNPVLTKVRRTLVRDGVVAACLALVVGFAAGWWLGRRKARAAPAVAS